MAITSTVIEVTSLLNQTWKVLAGLIFISLRFWNSCDNEFKALPSSRKISMGGLMHSVGSEDLIRSVA